MGWVGSKKLSQSRPNGHSSDSYNNDDLYDVDFVKNVKFTNHSCNLCKRFFEFKNKLFRHLRFFRWKKKKSIDEVLTLLTNSVTINKTTKLIVVNSHIKSNQSRESEYASRNWKYAIIKVVFLEESESQIDMKAENDVLNSECQISMRDREFIKKQISDVVYHKLSSLISIREVKRKTVMSFEWIFAKLMFEKALNDVLVLTIITIEIHIIEILKTNLLIVIDVLVLEQMIINFEKQQLHIESCDEFRTIISIKARENSHIKRIVRIKFITQISLKSTTRVSVSYHESISENRNFLFESQYTQNLEIDDEIYAHVVDNSLFFILVSNNLNKSISFSRRVKLSSVIEYNQDECYITSANEEYLVKRSNWKFNLIVATMRVWRSRFR